MPPLAYHRAASEGAALALAAAHPDAAFIAGGTYGRGPISAPGMEQVIADLNSKLENLGSADVPQVMEEYDSNAQAALGQ